MSTLTQAQIKVLRRKVSDADDQSYFLANRFAPTPSDFALYDHIRSFLSEKEFTDLDLQGWSNPTLQLTFIVLVIEASS